MPRLTTRLLTTTCLTIGALTLSGCGVLGSKEDTAAAGSGTATTAAVQEGNTKTTKTPEEKKSDTPGAREIFESLDSYLKETTSLAIEVQDDSDPSVKSVKISGTTDSDNVAVEVVGATGGTAWFRIIGDKNYIKGDDAFWKETLKADYTPTIAKKLKGKYFLSPEKPEKELQDLSPKKLIEAFDFSNTNFLNNFLTDVTKITYNGKPALKLVDKADDSVFMVVDAQAPYGLLEVNGNPANVPGSNKMILKFTERNSVPPVTAPTKDEIIKL